MKNKNEESLFCGGPDIGDESPSSSEEEEEDYKEVDPNDPDAFKKKALRGHNKWRKMAGLVKLEWDDKIGKLPPFLFISESL